MNFAIPSSGMTIKEILTKMVDLHDVLSMKDYASLAELCKVDEKNDQFFEEAESAASGKEK